MNKINSIVAIFIVSMCFLSCITRNVKKQLNEDEYTFLAFHPTNNIKYSYDKQRLYKYVIEHKMKKYSHKYTRILREKYVLSLIKYFKVNSYSDLVGTTFKSPKGLYGPSDVIHYLVVVGMHGGSYTPPSRQKIYNRVAKAFSKMQCPVLEDIDKNTVGSAMWRLYVRMQANHKEFKRFAKKVFELSSRKVKLAQVIVNKDPYYLIFKSGNKKMNVSFYPFTGYPPKPFSCNVKIRFWKIDKNTPVSVMDYSQF